MIVFEVRRICGAQFELKILKPKNKKKKKLLFGTKNHYD